MDLRLGIMASLENLTSWHSDWRGLRVVVFGLGVSGFSVADTLAELGAEVLVVAEKAEPELLDILDVLGVRHLTGSSASGVPKEVTDFNAELIVTSPGVRPEAELLSWASGEGIEIWIDVDLAWRLRDKTDKVAEWVLVTGTNGKTTTVQLTEAMINSSGKRAVACGNIGTPILDVIRDEIGFDYLVVELSSFQLHYMHQVEPLASAILNIAEDHLDWHGSFDRYKATKAKIYDQTKKAVIYNVADEHTVELVQSAEVQSEETLAVGFSTGFPADLQVGYVEENLIDRAFFAYRAKEIPLIATHEDISSIGVVTEHLLANVAAATALARAADIAPDFIRSAILNFKLDQHRIEVIAEIDGVTYIDDSKATNPHATEASLKSFERVIWIVGGLLKGVDIRPLVARNRERIKAAVVIGVDRSELVGALREVAENLPLFEIENSSDSVMAAAVARAYSLAEDGDVVLLAPAAASMDQFKDYADRGNQFAAAVEEIQRKLDG